MGVYDKTPKCPGCNEAKSSRHSERCLLRPQVSWSNYKLPTRLSSARVFLSKDPGDVVSPSGKPTTVKVLASSRISTQLVQIVQGNVASTSERISENVHASHRK